MPFFDGERVFIFNGELNGVRIKAEGRIGAEKIFNYIKRFERGHLLGAVARGVEIIEKRTRRIRAMNFMIGTRDEVVVCSHFSQEPEYFQLRESRDDERLIICSEPYGEFAWKLITYKAILPNGSPLWEGWFPTSKLEEKKKFYQDSGQPSKFYQE